MYIHGERGKRSSEVVTRAYLDCILGRQNMYNVDPKNPSVCERQRQRYIRQVKMIDHLWTKCTLAYIAMHGLRAEGTSECDTEQ